MPCGDDRRLYAFCYGEAMEQEGVEMKTLIALAILLAGNCWGQMPLTITNDSSLVGFMEIRLEAVTAYVTRETVTNLVHAKQYLNNSYGCLLTACKQDHSFWQDSPCWPFEGGTTRYNPDKRIVEVREIVRPTLDWNGKPFSIELENKLLDKWEERRVVEPPAPIIERWVIVPLWSKTDIDSLVSSNFTFQLEKKEAK